MYPTRRTLSSYCFSSFFMKPPLKSDSNERLLLSLLQSGEHCHGMQTIQGWFSNHPEVLCVTPDFSIAIKLVEV